MIWHHITFWWVKCCSHNNKFSALLLFPLFLCLLFLMLLIKKQRREKRFQKQKKWIKTFFCFSLVHQPMICIYWPFYQQYFVWPEKCPIGHCMAIASRETEICIFVAINILAHLTELKMVLNKFPVFEKIICVPGIYAISCQMPMISLLSHSAKLPDLSNGHCKRRWDNTDFNSLFSSFFVCWILQKQNIPDKCITIFLSD